MPIVSLFNNSQDNSAKQHNISSTELLESFREVAVGDDKLSGTAWSPCQYRDGKRSHDRAHTCFALVYDLDRDTDQKPGLLDETVQRLVENLENAGVNYAVHSTFSDFECWPRRKLRVVLPLAYAVEPDEWIALWHEHKKLCPCEPDQTKIHPGNLFFAPLTPASHAEKYFCQIVTNRKNLLSKLGVDVDQDAWLESVRSATEKRHALNRAAFALASLRAERGDLEDVVLAELWPALKSALERNKRSEPVKDWSAAEFTVRTAVRQAYAKDPLRETTQNTELLQIDEKLQRRAQRDLEKWERRVRADVRELDTAAFVLGTYVPHVLTEERVQSCLLRAYERSGSSVARADAESRIAVGLGRGKTKPKGQRLDWQSGLRTNEQGVFLGSDENVFVVLTEHPEMSGVLAYDNRRQAHVVLKQPPWDTRVEQFPGAFAEEDAPAMAQWIRDELGASTVGAQRVLAVALSVTKRNSFDPMVDWLESLQWDGQPRLDRWATELLGAPDDEWSKIAGSKWLISAVARTLKPGCKVDTVLTLVGEQGVGKSSALRALVPFGDLFADGGCDIHSKDTDVLLAKLVILEFSELVGIARKETEAVKRFLSAQDSTSRDAYARTNTNKPRRCVFGATTNRKEGFLYDTTGNRRFWPLNVGDCNIDGIEAVREQLWAEAKVRYLAQERWWLDAAENKLAKQAESGHMESNPLAEALRPFLECIPAEIRGEQAARAGGVDQGKRVWVYEGQMAENRPLWITGRQVAELFDLPFGRKTESQVTDAMRSLGLEPERRRVAGEILRVWRRVAL